MVRQQRAKSPQLVYRLLVNLDLQVAERLTKIANTLEISKARAIKECIDRFYESEYFHKLLEKERELAQDADIYSD